MHSSPLGGRKRTALGTRCDVRRGCESDGGSQCQCERGPGSATRGLAAQASSGQIEAAEQVSQRRPRYEVSGDDSPKKHIHLDALALGVPLRNPSKTRFTCISRTKYSNCKIAQRFDGKNSRIEMMRLCLCQNWRTRIEMTRKHRQPDFTSLGVCLLHSNGGDFSFADNPFAFSVVPLVELPRWRALT